MVVFIRRVSFAFRLQPTSNEELFESILLWIVVDGRTFENTVDEQPSVALFSLNCRLLLFKCFTPVGVSVLVLEELCSDSE